MLEYDVYCGEDAQRVGAREEEEHSIDFFGRIVQGDFLKRLGKSEYESERRRVVKMAGKVSCITTRQMRINIHKSRIRINQNHPWFTGKTMNTAVNRTLLLVRYVYHCHLCAMQFYPVVVGQ